jgi:Zn-dependent protease/predicted transcriptional regulator
MRKEGAIRVAVVGGIPIYIHWSFWLLIAWIILSALWYSGGNWTFVGWRLLLIGGLVVSVILHELGHAFAAAAFRIPTRDITMYPFGGVASIEKLPESPSQELVIALAGPLVNFLITGVIAAGLFLGGAPWEMSLSYFGQYELTLLDYFIQLAVLNTYLALFNLLPAFPMDGGRVLRAFLAMRLPYARATFIAATVGQIFAVFFALLGLFGNPVLILIGFFVFVAAENEKKAVEGLTLLKGIVARNAVMVHYPVLPATATLQAAVEALLSSQARSFLITDPQGRPVGSLSREQLISALHEGIPLTAPITQVMNEHLIAVDANTPLSEVMRILQAEDVPFVLVEEKTGPTPVLLGIIDAENIAEYLLIKKAQEAFASSISP